MKMFEMKKKKNSKSQASIYAKKNVFQAMLKNIVIGRHMLQKN